MKNTTRFHALAITLALSLVSGLNAQSDPNAEAKVVVTSEVVRPSAKVPPLGANHFGGRGVQSAAGNFIQNAGNEHPIWQNMHHAVNVEGRSFELDGLADTSWYKLWNDGFLSGAKVRIYRIVDKNGNPLDVMEGRPRFANIDDADHVILVGETTVIPAGEEGFPNGGWVVDEPPAGKKPLRVYLSSDSPELKEFDYIALEKDLSEFDMNWVHERVRAIQGPKDRPIWYWKTNNDDVRFSFYDYEGDAPSGMIDPGNSCMLIDVPAGPVTIEQRCFIGTDKGKESLYYTQLEPGKKYRIEAWMKQEDLGDGGQVTFFISPQKTPGHQDIHSTFSVKNEWAKYAYDFIAPERPIDAMHYGPAFSFTGPGKLWMDNARLFRYDSEEELEVTYTADPVMLQGLLDTQPETGIKGSHRIWVLDRDLTMDSLLSLYGSSQIRPAWRTAIRSQNQEMTLPKALMFDLATGDSPETRMVPHIVIQHMMHDEQDWRDFIEYMGAPYDPAEDTPETKPWAYMRYVQRGENGTPWTDEFREIIVELGNETWHNAKVEDWIGFAIYGAIHQGGAEYGLFSDYLIDQMKSSPYWNSEQLDQKVHFNLGGNYSGRVLPNGAVKGYAEEAIQRSPQAQSIGHANYVGPKWETRQDPLTEFNNEGLFSTIMGYQMDIKDNQQLMYEAQQKLAEEGVNYEIIAYEGGPSGYTADRKFRDMPGVVESGERYGKSQAMAVAALDAWLGSYLQGWTYQDYLGYQQGEYWSSHTMQSDGFRAHAPWLAMTLRNLYARGDLMQVESVQMPTASYETEKKGSKELPLVGVYAMEEGDRWSVFVISRKIEGEANGMDFGDGYSKVSLKLPFTSAKEVTLYKLEAAPGASNIDEEEIKIESESINPNQQLLNQYGAWQVNEKTGGDQRGLPPAAIYLYVFEGVK